MTTGRDPVVEAALSVTKSADVFNSASEPVLLELTQAALEPARPARQRDPYPPEGGEPEKESCNN
jgi:hypothetical protein